MRTLIIVLTMLLQIGCGSGFTATTTPSSSVAPPPGSGAGAGSLPPAVEKDIFKSMPQGTASLSAMCALNTGSDKFTQVFCGANPPAITSLASLHTALGLTNNANVACTTASGSLSKMETSVLTPRCIRFSQAGFDPNLVTTGYVRSTKTFVEVATNDPVQGIRFYLIKFELPCEAAGNCTPADYLTQSAESNWKNVSFYEDKQLKNTAMDCTSCHQPRGPNTPKRLLMVETSDPWNHWFHKGRPCGKTLLDDFKAAHTVATYAGLTPTEMENSDPNKLQAFVEDNGFRGATFGNNIYDSNQILYETSVTPGASASWQALYDGRVTGANQPAFGGTALPYHDCKQSDPQKLPAMTANYIGVVNGTIPKSASLNLAEVNLSTPKALAERFLTPAIGLQTAQQLVKNACLSCHNSNLDQTISRASFNAQDLTRNSTAIYTAAINRIKRGHTDVRRMPPPNFMELNAQQVQQLTDFFVSQGGRL